MKPDFDRAAAKAMEILIGNMLTETPIDPLAILLKTPGVRVLPFTRMAAEAGLERKDLVQLFGCNQDAATFLVDSIESVRYVVVHQKPQLGQRTNHASRC